MAKFNPNDIESAPKPKPDTSPEPTGEGTLWEWVEVTLAYGGTRRERRVILKKTEPTYPLLAELHRLIKKADFPETERQESYQRNADREIVGMRWASDKPIRPLLRDLRNAIHYANELESSGIATHAVWVGEDWDGTDFIPVYEFKEISTDIAKERIRSIAWRFGDFLETHQSEANNPEAAGLAQDFCAKHNWTTWRKGPIYKENQPINEELEGIRDIADSCWEKAQWTKRLLESNEDLSDTERKMLEEYASDNEKWAHSFIDKYKSRLGLCPECYEEIDLNYRSICKDCVAHYNLYEET